ncbi:MAG: DNA polymerase I, partial [Proteobacteria bacterium]|nr:DNA polymerase I [Pseudomonadota bacterium]
MSQADASPAASVPKKPRERIYLIDGSGYIFRAYHALPRLTRKDGTPTGAVSGFCNMLAKLVNDVVDEGGLDHIAVIFDASRDTFRNEIYSDYKANRPPAPEDLVPQFPFFREAVRVFNMPCIEMDGYEADDLIATYTKQAVANGYDVAIVSSDKDLMQLVQDGVIMRDPIKGLRPIGPEEVFAKFGVTPDKVIEVQALAGDSVDNVPGVPGIGIKTAAELINTYGDVETLLAHAEEIKQPKRREALIAHAEKARISRQLVILKDDVPVAESVDDFGFRQPDPEALFPFLEAMEFTQLADRMRIKLGAGPAPVATPKAITLEVSGEGYVTVDSRAGLEAWIAEATRIGSVAIAVHTRVLGSASDALVGVALATAAGRACYVPLAHVSAESELELGAKRGDDGTAAQIDRDAALALLKPLLENRGVLKIGHDMKPALIVLARHGIDIASLDDVLVLSHVLDAGLHGHGRDDLARHYLDRDLTSYKEVVGSAKAQITFDQVAVERATAFAAEDIDAVWQVYRKIKPRLAQQHMVTVYETMERPLIKVLARMESAGIRVDPKMLLELSRDFAKRAADLEAEIHQLAGHEFNVGSPKQLGEVLFDEMGLSGGKKTKTGAYATGADILDDLAAQGHDLAARVLDWRQLTKLKSTYTDSLQEQVDAATGRVHTTYGMAGAATGRLASNDPNLQNIPVRTEEGRKIRRAFVPDKGCLLVAADYSQIELRILAHIADIKSLLQAFADGTDIHALTASQVFGVPIEGMDPSVRRNAKAINFGIIYGISAFGLGRQLGIPRGAAAEYIKAYFERYPGIQDYMESTKVFCREHGYVETLFGRRIHIAGIHDKNPGHRSFSERAAINAPIQGSAADILKRAMVRVPRALDEAELTGRMLLTVHDELLFEVPEKEVEATARLVVKVMEGVAHLKVPLTVDVG